MVRNDNLSTAHILLRCDDNNHKACSKIRDAVFDKFNNVGEIQTVYPDENDKHYCVMGTFTIFRRDAKKLEIALYNTTTKYRGKTVKVNEVDVDVVC